MKTIKGAIEFKGCEYDYSAEVGEPGIDYIPDHITDIDPADGSALPDDIDYEELEAAAAANLSLLLWCECRGFEESHTGGGCFAFIRNTGDATTIITTANDCQLPQTLTEPVAIGHYDNNGRPIKVQICRGGIDSADPALL